MPKSADLMGLGFSGAMAQALGYTNKSITAAGTTSADATACDAQSTFFLMTATGSDGIRMNASAPLFTEIWIACPGTAGKVYPHTGGIVNGGSTDAGETVTATTVHIWMRISATAWVAVLGA